MLINDDDDDDDDDGCLHYFVIEHATIKEEGMVSGLKNRQKAAKSKSFLEDQFIILTK